MYEAYLISNGKASTYPMFPFRQFTTLDRSGAYSASCPSNEVTIGEGLKF
jgi:hypothetical protein